MDSDETLYATPRKVTDAADCDFYHVMEIPGYGPTTGGMWDLRGDTAGYLGNVDLAGKRVLEIGPASGYLTFYMESQGAEVVSVELPLDHPWDVVPDASLDLPAFVDEVKSGIEAVRNAYWSRTSASGARRKSTTGTSMRCRTPWATSTMPCSPRSCSTFANLCGPSSSVLGSQTIW
jgi:hypothetical protein